MTENFKGLANQMYDAATMTEFEQAVREMQQRFPKSKTWVNWWTQPGHRILIFKACRHDELLEELRCFYNMPTTNNVLESNNRNTNRVTSKCPSLLLHTTSSSSVVTS